MNQCFSTLEYNHDLHLFLIWWYSKRNSEPQLQTKSDRISGWNMKLYILKLKLSFSLVLYILYSHYLWRCVTIMGKTPYPSKDHDGQLQNESRVRSASMRTSQHKLTFLQWRAFLSGYDLLCACSLGWFVSGKQSRSSADQPRR